MMKMMKNRIELKPLLGDDYKSVVSSQVTGESIAKSANISGLFKSGETIVLVFPDDVKVVASKFICSLLEGILTKYPPRQIRSQISVISATSQISGLFNKVIENAKVEEHA